MGLNNRITDTKGSSIFSIADLSSLHEWEYYQDYGTGSNPSSDGTSISSGQYRQTYYTQYSTTSNCTFTFTLKTTTGNRYEYGLINPYTHKWGGLSVWCDTGSLYCRHIDTNGTETTITTLTPPTTDTEYILSITSGVLTLKDITNNTIVTVGEVGTGLYFCIRKWGSGNIILSNLTYQSQTSGGNNTLDTLTDEAGDYNLDYLPLYEGTRTILSSYTGNKNLNPDSTTYSPSVTKTRVYWYPTMEYPQLDTLDGDADKTALTFDLEANTQSRGKGDFIPVGIGRIHLKLDYYSYDGDDVEGWTVQDTDGSPLYLFPINGYIQPHTITIPAPVIGGELYVCYEGYGVYEDDPEGSYGGGVLI